MADLDALYRDIALQSAKEIRDEARKGYTSRMSNLSSRGLLDSSDANRYYRDIESDVSDKIASLVPKLKLTAASEAFDREKFYRTMGETRYGTDMGSMLSQMQLGEGARQFNVTSAQNQETIDLQREIAEAEALARKQYNQDWFLRVLGQTAGTVAGNVASSGMDKLLKLNMYDPNLQALFGKKG